MPSSAFPTYQITKWSSVSEQSKIIVPCSDNTVPSDVRTSLPSATGWETSASMSDGDITLTKYFFFTIKDGVTIRPREIPPIEVFRAPGFPKKHSRLPEDNRFVYLGNGELSKLNNDIDSIIWVYKATYTWDLHHIDEDENTKPWDRKPTNVSLSHPEVQKPFLYGYDEENRRFKTVQYNTYYGQIQVPTNPVVNSAGDRFELMQTKTNLQLNFTYCVRPSRFNINDVMDSQHTINKSKIKVIGIEIPARRGYMENIEPHYSVDDNGNEYWELSVSILYDKIGDGFQRHVMDVGNRAKWHIEGFPVTTQGKVNNVNDNGVITSYGSGALSPSSQAIYGWWPYDSTSGQFSPGKKFQIGNAQMLMLAKWKYDNGVNLNKKFGDFVYEKLEDIPLAPDGTVWFDAMTPGNAHYRQYHIKDFQEHPQRDWDSLNMPMFGVKW